MASIYNLYRNLINQGVDQGDGDFEDKYRFKMTNQLVLWFSLILPSFFILISIVSGKLTYIPIVLGLFVTGLVYGLANSKGKNQLAKISVTVGYGLTLFIYSFLYNTDDRAEFYLISVGSLAPLLFSLKDRILLYIGLFFPTSLFLFLALFNTQMTSYTFMGSINLIGAFVMSLLNVILYIESKRKLHSLGGSSHSDSSINTVGADQNENESLDPEVVQSKWKDEVSSFVDIYVWEYIPSQNLIIIEDRFWQDSKIESKVEDFDIFLSEQIIVDHHASFKKYFKSENIVQEQSFSFDFKMNSSEGDLVAWKLKGKYKTDEVLKTLVVSGVLININTENELEDQLAESYHALESTLNYSPSGILITSNSKIEYVNDQFLKMVNLDRAALISLDNPFQLVPNETSQYLDFVNQDESVTPISENFEFKLIRNDQSYLDVLLSHENIKYKGVNADLVVINDYTLRKKFQSDLEEKESLAKLSEEIAMKQKTLLEEILNKLPLMLTIYDERGQVYLTNSHTKEKYGWDHQDLKDLDALDKTVNDPINNGLLHKSLSVENNEWIVYKMLDKWGKEYLSEWTSNKVGNGYLIRLGIDITEKTKIKQDYEKAIEQLQLVNQKLTAREEKLALNQDQLKEANIRLYEQNKVLEENENKFKLLSEASHEAVFMLDQGVVFEYNQSAYKLLDFEEIALVNTHISDLVVPSQRNAILEILKNNSSVENFEITFVKNSGKLFYGELQSKPFIYKGKNVMVFTMRDITYRKRIEIEAKNNETNIRNLIDNINIGIYLQTSGGETFSNHTFRKILGVEYVDGQFSFLDFVEYKDVKDISQAISDITSGESSYWSKDIMLITQQGTERSEVNISLVTTTYKLKPALLISIIDINQRKKAEKALQVSYAYQNALLNSGDISYWAADRNFNLLFTNKYHEEKAKLFFDSTVEIGHDVRSGFSKNINIEDIESDFQQVLKGENLVKVIRTNNAEHNLWLELNLSPIHISGEITGVLVRTRDITANFNQVERTRQSEERLREAQFLAKIGSWEENKKNDEIYWSAGMYEIFNQNIDFDPQVKSLSKLLGRDNQKRLLSHYEEALSSGQPVEKQYNLVVGELKKWLRIIMFKSESKNNNDAYIKGTVQDITESKLAEIQIRDNENLLNTIIDNLPVIFHMFDANGLSLRINDELRKFFQLTDHTSPVGRYYITKDEKLFGEQYIKIVKRAFLGEKVVLNNIEVDLSKAQGRAGMEGAKGVKYLDSIFTPILDQHGNIRTVVYLGIDNTNNVLKSMELEKKHNEVLEVTKLVSEYRLVALRSAMNPHFIFNVLNSIQYFISKNDKEQALTHLSMFSKLVRKILESSISNKISINEEITMLKYYIDLENLRFDTKFEVLYDIDDTLLEDDVLIPSLIIQPYVENSIIHGLLNKKDGVGRLAVSIKDKDDHILCIIEDNGVGRAASAKFKDMDHKSLGTKVTEERLKIINKFDDISLKVVDLYDKDKKPSGTRTELKIKIN